MGNIRSTDICYFSVYEDKEKQTTEIGDGDAKSKKLKVGAYQRKARVLKTQYTQCERAARIALAGFAIPIEENKEIYRHDEH